MTLFGRRGFLSRALVIALALSISGIAQAATKVVFLTTTGGGTNWTVPADWTNVNTVECIGGGTGGQSGGRGGGAGGYSKIVNFSSTPAASVPYQIAGANGGSG